MALAGMLAGVAHSEMPVSTHSVSFKIGLLLPPTEADAGDIRRGAELGLAAVNRQPGAKVEIIVRGQAGQWGSDGNEAVMLALDDGADALLAPSSGATVHQALQVAGRTRVPVVSLCPDTSVTRAGVPWTVRVAARTDDEAAALFAVIKQATGKTSLSVVALVPPERAGREAGKDLQHAARGANVEAAQIISVAPGDTNFTPLLQPALAARPDAILLWLDAPEAGRLAGAVRAAGYSGCLAGPGSLCCPAFFRAGGGSVAGVLIPVPAAITSPGERRERFQKDLVESSPLAGETASPSPANPPPNLPAALAFDAVLVLADVLRHADGRPAFREFPLPRSLSGVTGELTFDREGNRRGSLQVLALRADGSFAVAWPKASGP
jgi:ABC-type branched-subunit amino acid transport system substrate-binding protein